MATAKKWIPVLGQKVKVRGCDVRCEPTIETARVVELLEPPIDCGVSPHTGRRTIQDCVIECDGFLVKFSSADFIA